jgi:hypothetical protein
MSKITDFYTNNGLDNEGRSFEEIMFATDDWLEVAHDWVQWVFPLQDLSNFNENAPILTDEEVQIFRSDPKIQKNLEWAYFRFLHFLGLNYQDHQIIEGENFEKRKPHVWAGFNHNYLRITRFIACLQKCDRQADVDVFYEWLTQNKARFGISDNTFDYWTRARKGLPLK